MKYKEETFPPENDDIYHIEGASIIAGENPDGTVDEHKDDETQAIETRTNA